MIIYYINIKLFKFDNFFILLKIIYLINIYLYFIHIYIYFSLLV